ncbi:MAG: DNA-3-methyladenine glycosylase [Propionibacterium sp.]|nr:DNA-3-methyladenine glycosylase [Propionibacterium sp.]
MSDVWPPGLTGDAVSVAPRLLGGVVVHRGVAVRLSEVEAYAGVDDPASHAHRGPTARNAAMFAGPGHVYVYLSYGIHHAVNIVTAPAGTAAGVLLRAGEVVAGLDLARRRRPGVGDARLASGPGNLGRVLGFTLDTTGRRFQVIALPVPAAAMVGDEPEDSLLFAPAGAPVAVLQGPRVGVGAAHERPWRFWIAGDPTVSRYRRAASAG